MSNSTTPEAASSLPFAFGGLTVPEGCRRIFITAELEPSNGDPRIQPTGFPDIGPVLYPDPSGKDGLICLIESEASMANRLEEVCLSNRYEGALSETFAGLPYLRAEEKGTFKTASTIDGHRFASDFLAKGKANFGNGAKALAEHIKASLGMNADGKTMPVARIPDVFPLAMELDTMSLIHGFQISNEQISFVGLRHPRALTASIVGLDCERVVVPGIKFNVGQVESESGQAIFQKQRITAQTIEARFSIDVGLLASLRLDALNNGKVGEHQAARFRLVLAIALWKVAALLDLLRVELSLRTECKLRLKPTRQESSEQRDRDQPGPNPHYRAEGGETLTEGTFPVKTLKEAVFSGKGGLIESAHLPRDRHPLILNF